MLDPSYITDNWPWLLPWLLFVAALIAALRNLYALEQSRRALARAEAEKAKLDLEITHLKNPPDTRQARREIYDRLRLLLEEITPDAQMAQEHVLRLMSIGHDVELWFPRSIQTQVWDLAGALNGVYVAQRKSELDPIGSARWKELLEKEANSRLEIASFLTDMTEIFRPHITLMANEASKADRRQSTSRRKQK